MNGTAIVELTRAPGRYTGFSGNADQVYGNICRVLSGRKGEADWSRFSPEDWVLLLQMAHVELEGIGPMLYWHFRDNSWPEAMPVHIRKKLEQSYYNTYASNMLLFAELSAILDAFGAAGIEVIVLKGADLALTVYEDIGLRPMGDIDLFVKKTDQDRAAQIMSALGFEEGWEKPVSKTWLPERHRSYHKRGQVHMIVEIHDSLIGDQDDIRTPAMSWPFEHCRPVRLDPRFEEIVTLIPEAHALFLAAHAYQQHGLRNLRLIWLTDLYFLLSGHGFSFEYSLELLDKLPWGTGYRMAVEDLVRDLHLQVPENILDRLRSNRDEKMDRLVLGLSGKARDRVSLHSGEIGFLNTRGRLRYFRSILFPSMTYLHRRYQFLPRWLWLFYYPARWADVLKELLLPKR